MKKITILFIIGISLFFFTQISFAQTPPYYNYVTLASPNSFPFNSASPGKGCQWLVAPGEFGTPSPAPAGNITNLWFNLTAISGTATYTTFQVRLGQTALTSLPAGVIYSGPMTVVYSNPSAVINWTSNGWINITLSTPFLYNPAQSLVVEVTQCGLTGTGSTIGQNALTGTRRNYLTPTACVQAYGNQDASVPGIGLTISTGPMIYISSTTTQGNTSTIFKPGLNQEILGIQVVTTGSISPINATIFTLNTNGSTNAATDITNAKLWFTGTSSAFATTTQFGSTYSSPSGAFTIAGTQALATGTNYFWLSYDVPGTATTGNVVDAECNSIIVSDTTRTPSTQAPAGSRPIAAALCGTYTIPGDFATIAAAVTALNTAPLCGPVIFNVAAGYTETAANLTINNVGSFINTITFQKSGAGANPLIQSLVAGSGTLGTAGNNVYNDAFIKLNGTDYITFNGIDMKENYTGGVQTLYIEYGFLLLRNSATDGCKNVTIKNCTVQLYYQNIYSQCIGLINYNNAGVATNPTAISGRHENIFIDGNYLTSTHVGVLVYGYSDVSPYNLFENNIQIGTTTANTIKNSSYSTTSYGVYMIYADSVKVANNNFISGSIGGLYTNATTLYGIMLSTAINSNADVYNNSVRDSSMIATGMTTSQMTGIYCSMGSSGTNNFINVYNNTVECKYGTATTGTLYSIYMTTSPQNMNVYANNVTNNQIGSATTAGTGLFYGIYSATATSTTGSIYQFYNNNVNNNTRLQLAMSSGTTYGMYIPGGALTLNIYGNNVNNNAWPGSGTRAGIYVSATTPNISNTYNNTVQGNTSPLVGATASTGTFYCIWGANGSNSTGVTNIYSNNIYNNSSTGTTQLYGIYSVSSYTTNTNNVYLNQIYNQTANGASGGYLYGIATSTGNHYIYRNLIRNLTTSSGYIYGLQTGGSSNNYIYNNFIQELNGPNSNWSPPGIIGMYFNNGATYNNYCFYNSIYLNTTVTGTTTSAGIYAVTAPNVDLRNNIVVNNSATGAGGRAVAYQRSANIPLTTYLNTSSFNCFRAGVPSVSNLIYYDGGNSDQTIAAYKTRVYPRDQQSFTENPPFVNVGVTPYDLHINTGIATNCESGGIPITAPIIITTDYDNGPRSVTTPDVGADEFVGIPGPDVLPPYIVYTPMGNGGTGGKYFNNVTVTDVSGVNTTAGTRPRVYYKKSTNANTFVDNTSGTDGWKWVESNGTTSPFDFNIDYTKIFGGSVITGDIIQYFVIAQDLAGTPNVGTNQVTLSAAPTSVNLYGTGITTSGTINQYTIVQTWSGIINVGSTYTYPSLTNAGGIFAAINAAPTFSGNVTIVIKEDLLSETGTNALNQWAEDGAGGYTLTITCDPGTPRTVSGSYVGGLIRLNGADRVIFDGIATADNVNKNGRSTDAAGGLLTFQNTSPVASTATIMLISLGTGLGCNNVQIKNCNIKTGMNTVASTYGIHIGGTSLGSTGADNDNCTIQNNKISLAYYGIWAYSTSNVSAGGNDNLLITQNRCGDDVVANSIYVYGIYSYNNVNPTISSNTVDHLGSSTNYGIYLTSNINPLVTQNTIRDFNNTTTQYSMYLSSNTNPTVTLNNIYNQTSTSTMYLIYNTSPVTSYTISQNNIYNNTNTSTGAMYCIYLSSCPNGTVSQNNIYNINPYGTFYGMYMTTVTGSTVSLNNIYNITATNGYVPYGMYITGSSTTSNFYKNKINTMRYNLTAYYLSPRAIYLTSSANPANLTFANNIIYDIWGYGYTPIPSGGLAAIYINSGGDYHFYYNSVNLYGNMSSSSAQVCADMYVAAAVGGSLDIRNNSFTNTIVNTTAGSKSYAVFSDAPAGTYSNINYNDYWPGSGVQSYVGFLGSDRTTIADWRTGTGQDVNSKGTDPTYNSNTNMQPLPGSPLLGSAVLGTGILDDYLGVARSLTFPTIGAYEGANDIAGPSIVYTPLSNTSSTSNRSFSPIDITDASGVNTVSGTRPRCYYKKTTHANTWNDNTSGTDGWKWVETNGTTSPFDFTIDYTKLYEGSGVAAGDNIQYFVVSQDLWTTPNLSINSGTFALPPTSVDLTAAQFPLSGTIRQYSISFVYAGAYLIGAGQPYLSLTGSTQGFFAALNSGIVNGDITAFICSDITEDGTNQLNPITYSVPGSNFSVTIKPYTATEKVISGNVTGSMITFNGSNFITIDGNGGLSESKKKESGLRTDASGTKYLRFRNTNVTGATFSFINDARRNTITDCYIESNNSSLSSGTIVFGNSTGANGNDSNTIQYCDIRDRSDVTGFPVYAIYSNGSTGTTAQYNSYNVISNNNIYNFYIDGNISGGIFMTTGTGEYWTITGNSFYQTSPRITTSLTYYTAWNIVFIGTTSIVGLNVSNNYIGGSAPMCGGQPWIVSNGVVPPSGMPTFIYAIRGGPGTTIPSTIQNNIIQNFRMNVDMTCLTAAATIFSGIIVSAGDVNIGSITGNQIGNNSDTGNVEINFYGTTTIQPFVRAIRHQASGSVDNNIIGSFNMTGAATMTNGYVFAGIAKEGTPLAPISISNNIIGSTSVTNNILADAYVHEMSGIYSTSATQPLTMNNNIVSNMTSNGTLSIAAATVYGLRHTGTSPPVITNNTVNNLIASNAANSNNMYGIYCFTAAAGQVISNNAVYSLYSLSTNTINYVGTVGILTGTSGSGTMSRNRVYDLRNASTVLGSDIDALVPQGGTWICSNNQVTLTNGESSYMMYNNDKESLVFSETFNKFNNTGFVNTSKNIYNDKVQINNNKKTDFPLTSIDLSEENKTDIEQRVQIEQMKKEALEKLRRSKTPINSMDNIIFEKNAKVKQNDNNSRTIEKNKRVESPIQTNDIVLLGILDANQTGNWSYYYNSVYLGGTIGTGVSSSAAYVRVYTGTTTLRNNLFFNGRIGGTANFAISNEAATPGTGWPSTASNYNVLVSSNASTIGEWGIGINRTIDEWRTSSLGDKQTWATTTSTINAGNLFTSIPNGNLNIQTANVEAWLVSGKGIAVAGQTTDFGGVDTRSVLINTGVTDIGSDEFGLLSTTPPSATESGTPAFSTTTNYTLWGRTLCSIEWGPNGTFPSSMDVKYFSGVNNANALVGNYQNGYWTVTPTLGSMSVDAKYNIIFNFGDNETYTIVTPATNTILAKYESAGSGGSWEVYPAYVTGWTNWTSQSDWANLKIRVDSLQTFSDFALTDATAPLPVELASFTANVNKRNVTLSWVTTYEHNNKGFEIQRRKFLKEENKNKIFSEWNGIKFIDGAGNSNSQKSYTYSDVKLDAGNYQYRLKQTDYNNNSEYFNLVNPTDVVIGKPNDFDLSQNYPNPSNPVSKIDYQLPFKAKISIKIYDVIGREVVTLVNDVKDEGYYTAVFDGTNLSSGIYFYMILAEGNGQKFTKTMKMVLVK